MNEKIYNSFNLAYKDYDLQTKSDHWKIQNKNFLERIKKFKLIPRKVLEKLFKIYY